jgi:nitrate reductase gamma subunit
MNVLLWGVLPYVMMAVLIGGLIWRYRYDQFGWTTRSSQLYESRLLRIGSPLFHFGILVVIIGHIGGLVIPKSWTDAVGVTEGMYHFNALLWGTLAGVCTLIGILILIYRRRTTGPVFMATTKNDKAMYVVLVAAIVAGLATTVLSVFGGHEDVTYRDTVSPWFRSPSGHSRAWYTPSRFRCTTCSAPTSSTGAGMICPLREPPRHTEAGPPSAPVTAAQTPERRSW